MLNKPLWREVGTLGLYWLTQPKLCPILLYSTVKGSTNQNLITKQVIDLPLLTLQVFLILLLTLSYTPHKYKKLKYFFNTKPLLAFTNSSLNEYEYSTTLQEWINNKARLQNDFT